MDFNFFLPGVLEHPMKNGIKTKLYRERAVYTHKYTFS